MAIIITGTFTAHEEVCTLPLEREMIQTKTVDKIKPHFMFSKLFFPKILPFMR